MKKNKSIKFKIFIYLIGFCGLLIMLLWFFQVIFLDSFYKWTKMRDIENAAIAIEKNIDAEDNVEIVVEISDNYDVCLVIAPADNQDMEIVKNHVSNSCTIHKAPDLNMFIERTKIAGGELLEQTRSGSIKQGDMPDTKPPENSFLQPTEQTGLQGAVPRPFGNRDGQNMQVITFSKIVTTQNNGRVIILLDCVITPVNATVKTLQIQLYFVTGFMLLVSILLAILISKKVAKPIVEINQSAGILASGDYDVFFTGGGYSEIDELSQTLNYAANELKKTDSLQKELIANISHDLRTPLTLIAGYAEAMRDLPGEDNVENAQVIIDEARKLSSLVKDVLDISRVQSGVQVLQLSKFNITKILNADIGRMQEFLDKDGYDIVFEYQCEAFVNADETRISQVFYNLLNNAVHYTGDDKKIIIRQMVKDGRVKIEVTDTGQGIAPENLNDIWDRYYKLNEVHRRNKQGAGLGLSIVKSAIALHRGEYGVTSEIGIGSTFYFILDLAE